MKKIAIVTTHRANNFGAVLQAFSLVSACRELGVCAEILDWRCRHFEWVYHVAWRMYRNPIPALKHLLWFVTEERSIRKAFDEFRKLMPMSPKITRRTSLTTIAREYDAVIVGSDQVWNPLNSAIDPLRFDRTNLLDFVPEGVKKYAYAASMGTREITPSSLVPEFVTAWKSFNLITMREHAGAEYVSKKIGLKVRTVVDPVLLHDADFWRRFKGRINRRDGAFVFVYNVKGSSFLRKAAEEHARENGLPIVDVVIPAIVPTQPYTRVGAGPADFLSYIDEAESVFTNSFHASAFSVIFGKRLYIHQSERRGNANSRIETLMRFASLQAKVVMHGDNETISFVDASKRDSHGLDLERKRSQEMLLQMV